MMKRQIKNPINIPSRTIWHSKEADHVVEIIDQRYLPHSVRIAALRDSDQAALAIQEMWVRGAPLIGATAAYGLYLACVEAARTQNSGAYLKRQYQKLLAARPTAINLQWALERMQTAIDNKVDWTEKILQARQTADAIVEEDVQLCDAIGMHGLKLIQEISLAKKGETVQILTHCNAGRMATVEWGTATAPIYKAHLEGIPIHVWVDETRPRNQGARITAWELAQAGIPHTVIADNTGGHLMQHAMVDICLVGSDRTTYTGDVANKIGTYLKALAAFDNQIPFYVALPSSTIDWQNRNGLQDIPIEQRDAREVSHIWGWDEQEDRLTEVRLIPQESPGANYAFDVTPGKYISGLITERGICPATESGIAALFPTHRKTTH